MALDESFSVAAFGNFQQHRNEAIAMLFSVEVVCMPTFEVELSFYTTGEFLFVFSEHRGASAFSSSARLVDDTS
jgi:hypothetical protein